MDWLDNLLNSIRGNQGSGGRASDVPAPPPAPTQPVDPWSQVPAGYMPDRRPQPMYEGASALLDMLDPVAQMMEDNPTWFTPLEGPSRVMGGAVAGVNPFVWGEGGINPEAPTFGEALVEKGAPGWVGALAELGAVPDPLGASKIRDLLLLTSLIPGFRGIRALSKGLGDTAAKHGELSPEFINQLLFDVPAEGRLNPAIPEDLRQLSPENGPEEIRAFATQIRDRIEDGALVGQIDPTDDSVFAGLSLARRMENYADVLDYQSEARIVPMPQGSNPPIAALAGMSRTGGMIDPDDILTRFNAVSTLRRNLPGVNADPMDRAMWLRATAALGDEVGLAASKLADTMEGAGEGPNTALFSDILRALAAEERGLAALANAQGLGRVGRAEDLLPGELRAVADGRAGQALDARAGDLEQLYAEYQSLLSDEGAGSLIGPTIRYYEDAMAELARAREDITRLGRNVGEDFDVAMRRPLAEVLPEMESALPVTTPTRAYPQGFVEEALAGLSPEALQALGGEAEAIDAFGRLGVMFRDSPLQVREGLISSFGREMADEMFDSLDDLNIRVVERRPMSAGNEALYRPEFAEEMRLLNSSEDTFTPLRFVAGLDDGTLTPQQAVEELRDRLIREGRNPEDAGASAQRMVEAVSEAIGKPMAPAVNYANPAAAEAALAQAAQAHNMAPEAFRELAADFVAAGNGEDFLETFAAVGIDRAAAEQLLEHVAQSADTSPWGRFYARQLGKLPEEIGMDAEEFKRLAASSGEDNARQMLESSSLDAEAVDALMDEVFRGGKPNLGGAAERFAQDLADRMGVSIDELADLAQDPAGFTEATGSHRPAFLGRDWLGLRDYLVARPRRGALPTQPIPDGALAPGVDSWRSAFDGKPAGEAEQLRQHFAGSRGSLSGTFRGQARLDEVMDLPGARNEHIRFEDSPEDQRRIEELAESMRQHGYFQDQPIMIYVEQDGTVQIGEGNHRVRAAQLAGLEHIPVDVRYFGGADGQPDVWMPEALRRYIESGGGATPPRPLN